MSKMKTNLVCRHLFTLFLSIFCRIFQFENFLRTRKRVFADNNIAAPDEDEAIVGMYVTVYVNDVPRHLFNSWKEKNDKLAPSKQVKIQYAQ